MSIAAQTKPAALPVVLIVDPDDDTRALYRQALKTVACEIVEAADGRDALVKALVRRPAVVVMETILPFIDGYALCQLLRHDSATRASRIIMLTSDADPSNVERARTADADTILVKPCLAEDLFREMQRLLNRADHATRGTLPWKKLSGEGLGDSPASQARSGNWPLARAHQRFETTAPPLPPPELVCPQCDRPLTYKASHLGGVSSRHPEQWDYYECGAGCGTFQYRQRTRKLRRVT